DLPVDDAPFPIEPTPEPGGRTTASCGRPAAVGDRLPEGGTDESVLGAEDGDLDVAEATLERAQRREGLTHPGRHAVIVDALPVVVEVEAGNRSEVSEKRLGVASPFGGFEGAHRRLDGLDDLLLLPLLHHP